MGFWTKQSHANRPTTRNTAKWRLRECHSSNWCIFEICICLFSFQPNGSNTTNVIIDILTKHAYLPTIIKTDKRCFFVSKAIPRVAEIPGTKLKHATTKHAQTIRVLERWVPMPNQHLFQNGIGQIQETMAPVSTHFNPKLEHHLPF